MPGDNSAVTQHNLTLQAVILTVTTLNKPSTYYVTLVVHAHSKSVSLWLEIVTFVAAVWCNVSCKTHQWELCMQVCELFNKCLPFGCPMNVCVYVHFCQLGNCCWATEYSTTQQDTSCAQCHDAVGRHLHWSQNHLSSLYLAKCSV